LRYPIYEVAGTGAQTMSVCDLHHARGQGGVPGFFRHTPKQEHDMTTKLVREGRELATDELNTVSGGKGIEAQDRMGNFEIQRLMSSYNQAETLASSVLKKLSETNSGVIGKI
jgi:hypothetical protein